MKSKITFVALQAALRAGNLLKKGFGTDFKIESKTRENDLVTEFDKKAEALIFECIKSFFPEHAFLAEESGKSENSSPYLWIIDPLDGTTNFSHNVPLFAVSIAALHKEEIVSSVIYLPMLEELFIAEKEEGAYLNGKRLKVSTQSDLKRSLLVTGFPYNIEENPLSCIESVSLALRRGYQLRDLGSACIDLAYVAAGRFELLWNAGLQPWDIAAGKLLVEEAGGLVTDQRGSPLNPLLRNPLLASNGILHQEFIDLLNDSTKKITS